MFKQFSRFLLLSSLLISCSGEDQDDNSVNVVSNNNTSTTVTPTVTIITEINDFIWDGLNEWYYWQEDVPNLDDSKTSDANSYISYLNSYPDSSEFFESLIYGADRFSWINDNYEELEQQLSGVSASNGMNFIIGRQCLSCNELIAAVSYVLPDSDASEKGIIRGDLFNQVNGEILTVDNYIDLLYSDDLTYTIDLVNFDSGSNTVTPRNITVELNKIENFQEIPIHKNLVIEQGDRRIAYMMYNRFLSQVDSDGDGNIDYDFNQALIDVFTEFSTENVTDMVLDLRYNPGGSTLTARYLSSMITGQFTGEIFSSQLWNSKIMTLIYEINNDNNPDNDYDPNNYFLDRTSDGTPLPALQLPRLYVLTSSRTASASELVINALSPYIEVVVIGQPTSGKNVASITLYDYVDPDQQTRNPNHRYAMQPIVQKVANSEGYADFEAGLIPDIDATEKASTYGVLGDPSEPLLALAIDHITGNPGKSVYVNGELYEILPDPHQAIRERMFTEMPSKLIEEINLSKSGN